MGKENSRTSKPVSDAQSNPAGPAAIRKDTGLRQRALRVARARPRLCWLILTVGCIVVLWTAAIVAAAVGESRIGTGPVRVRLSFPSSPRAQAEPLVVTGGTGQADFLFVKYVGNGYLQFAYDDWGRGGPHSDPIRYTAGHPYVVEVEMPSLNLIQRLREGEVAVALDGQTVFRSHVVAHLGEREAIHVGTNPAGGTVCNDRFSGEIVSVERVGDQGRVDGRVRTREFFARTAPGLVVAWLVGALCSFLMVLWMQEDSASRSVLARRFGRAVLAPILCATAVVPLMLVNHRSGGDWSSHELIVAYYGRFFLEHLRLPGGMDTNDLIGQVHTLFYGEPVYGGIGVLSSVLGPDLGLHLVVFCALLAQFASVRMLLRMINTSEMLATTAAALTTWAIYPLTNLYNRGAVGEFLAVCFMNAAACCIVAVAVAPEEVPKRPLAMQLALFSTLAMAAHPITTIFGAMSLAGLGLGCLIFAHNRRFAVAAFGLTSALGGLALAPWVYLLSIFYRHLGVVHWLPGQEHSVAALSYFNFDTFWKRMAPFPWDFDARIFPLPGNFTLNLDAQLNLPLLLLIAGLAILLLMGKWKPWIGDTPRRTGVAPFRWPLALYMVLFGATLFAGTFWLSLARDMPDQPTWRVVEWPHLPGFLRTFQFAYRLVTYQNLGLLILVAALGWAQSALRPRRSLIAKICCFVLGLALTSTALKSTRGWKAGGPGPIFGSDDQILTTRFMTPADYAVMDGPQHSVEQISLARRRVKLRVKSGEQFGDVLPEEVLLEVPTVVTTDVLMFPWNRLYVDGKAIDNRSLIRDDHLTALELDRGRHRIEYRFEPDRIWTLLRVLSWLTFTGIIVAYFVVSLREQLGREAATAAQSEHREKTPAATLTRGRA
jgi:hypothetical protein